MYQVAIVFKNGSKVAFCAQEFDIDLSTSRLTSMNSRYDEIHRVTYEDTGGQDVPLYLNPTEVAGIAVAPVEIAEDGLRLSQ